MTKTPYSGFAFHGFRQKFVRVEAALHEELSLARADEFDGFLGSGSAMRHVDHLETVEIEGKGLGNAANLVVRSYEYRLDELRIARFERALKRSFVARIRNRRCKRRHSLRRCDKALVFL